MNLFLCLQFPRSNVKSHSQTHIESHLNLALLGLEATQHQVHELVTVVKEQSQQIERQSQQIERQSQQIERQSQQIERQSQQIERQSVQIERLMSKDKEQSEKMERAISTVQVQPPQKEQRVPIDQILPTPFEWEIKILNIASQGSVSRPFFLFERGYKYLLKIKKTRGRRRIELEVFIKVVPGEFDELLSWPCREKVRVTWNSLDGQSVGKSSQFHVTDFEKDREPCSRPLNDDHHAYRRVLHSIVFLTLNTILIRVNRE